MSRYTGPKHRLARREGVNILEKESPSLLRRLTIPPGMHGPKGTRRKQSEYGVQLREKQKAKRIYSVSEKQFTKYLQSALKVQGKTGETLLQLLERRLDNIVYKLGFVPSRAMARQLVSHGHVSVNGKVVNTPSFSVDVGDVVALTEKAQNIPVVRKSLETENPKVPGFLERKGTFGKVARIPERDEIQSNISEQLIVEYYSR